MSLPKFSKKIETFLATLDEFQKKPENYMHVGIIGDLFELWPYIRQQQKSIFLTFLSLLYPFFHSFTPSFTLPVPIALFLLALVVSHFQFILIQFPTDPELIRDLTDSIAVFCFSPILDLVNDECLGKGVTG